MGKTIRSVSFDDEEDADILTWLDGQENVSATVRKAVRALMVGGGVSLQDVYQAIKAVERKLESGVVVVAEGEAGDEDWAEPADAAAALDELARL